MEFVFEAPVGQRVLKNGFMGISLYSKFSKNLPTLWWCFDKKKWVESGTIMPKGGSSHAPCNSYKSFIRHLRKHPELSGYEVVLVSKFIGHNILCKVE